MQDIKANQVEDILRRLSVKQLEALTTFIPDGKSSEAYLSVEKASQSIHTADDENKTRAVGGVISSLAKIRTEYGPLILPAGKSDKEGMRWTLNQKVITRKELREILVEIPGINI